MRRTIFRTFAASGLLSAGVVVGALAIDARMAHPAEVPQCKLPIAALGEMFGWRILEGAKAKAYISTAFTNHPPADAVAFTVAGDKAAVALAQDGCIIGQQVIPAKMHRAVLDKAFGILA
jgi:hypothetical protein